MKYIYILLFSVCFVINTWAQDPQFTQFYAAPLILNPAFAGATLESRAILNGRAQWAGLTKPFITYAASLDHNFEKIKSGLGIVAIVDKAGTGVLGGSSLSGIYSYRVKLNSKWTFRPAVQFTYASRSLDYYKLTFGDQLDLNAASGIVTGETFDNSGRVNYFDFSSGGLIHDDKIWIGLSAHHLNRPNQSLNEGQSIIPVKMSLHGGIKIDLANAIYKTHGRAREQTLTPAFMYKTQGKYDQLDIGLYYHYEPLVVGAWYRGIPILKRYEPGYINHDALAVLLGFKQDNFTIGYSYDLTVSSLGATRTAGSHEISLSYTFGENGNSNRKKKVRKKDMVIPCPKF